MRERKRKNHMFRTALMLLAAALGIAALSAVPLLSLWAGDRAALEQPHTRTAQAGTLSLTCDDVYITRMLKKLAGAQENDPNYTSVWGVAPQSTVTQSDEYDLHSLLAAARDAGLLPDAWYQNISGALDGTFYISTDSLGFTDYRAQSMRESDRGVYSIGLTIETQSKSIVGLFASVDEADGLAAPDASAVLAAYTQYLGVEQANDWAVPADTCFAQNSIYSANAELLLSVQTGVYTAYADSSVSASDRAYPRRYFCLNARSVSPDTMRQYQAYTRSFDGVPDTSFATQEMHDISWQTLWPVSTPEAAYELAACGQHYDEETQAIVYECLILKTDYAARTQKPLCGIDGCQHTDERCPAYVLNPRHAIQLGIIDGRVCLLNPYADTVPETNCPWLEAADPAGMGRKRLCTFPGARQLSLTASDGQAAYGQTDGKNGVRIDMNTGALTPFSIQSGGDFQADLLGAAGKGLVLNVLTASLNLSICPSAGKSEAFSSVWNGGLAQEGRTVYYDTSTGLRRVLPPSEMKNRALSGGFSLGMWKGKWFFVERGEKTWTLWEEDIPSAAPRELHTFSGSDPNLSYHTLLPAMAAGQDSCLKLCAYDRSGKTETTLVNLGTKEVFSCAWHVQGSDTYSFDGPLAQTSDGRWLVAVREMDGTEDSPRYTYALIDTQTLKTGVGEPEQIEPWLPEPALG